jgi:hypothetical protein
MRTDTYIVKGSDFGGDFYYVSSCSCMTCPFLGDGSGAQISINQNNLSFKKYVYSYTHNIYTYSYIDIQLKGLLKKIYRYIVIT